MRWVALFAMLGLGLMIAADPVTGGNFVVLGYLSLAIAVGLGIRWATTTGYFDDGDGYDGRTKR